MYTFLTISIISLIGIFVILASGEVTKENKYSHNVIRAQEKVMGRPLIITIWSVFLKWVLTVFAGVLRFITPRLGRIQKSMERKITNVTRRVSVGNERKHLNTSDRTSSGFLRDLARHKKLVAKTRK